MDANDREATPTTGEGTPDTAKAPSLALMLEKFVALFLIPLIGVNIFLAVVPGGLHSFTNKLNEAIGKQPQPDTHITSTQLLLATVVLTVIGAIIVWITYRIRIAQTPTAAVVAPPVIDVQTGLPVTAITPSQSKAPHGRKARQLAHQQAIAEQEAYFQAATQARIEEAKSLTDDERFERAMRGA